MSWRNRLGIGCAYVAILHACGAKRLRRGRLSDPGSPIEDNERTLSADRLGGAHRQRCSFLGSSTPWALLSRGVAPGTGRAGQSRFSSHLLCGTPHTNELCRWLGCCNRRSGTVLSPAAAGLPELPRVAAEFPRSGPELDETTQRASNRERWRNPQRPWLPVPVTPVERRTPLRQRFADAQASSDATGSQGPYPASLSCWPDHIRQHRSRPCPLPLDHATSRQPDGSWLDDSRNMATTERPYPPGTRERDHMDGAGGRPWI